jgi:hypothetical protein
MVVVIITSHISHTIITVPINLVISSMLAETRDITMEVNSIIITLREIDGDIEW